MSAWIQQRFQVHLRVRQLPAFQFPAAGLSTCVSPARWIAHADFWNGSRRIKKLQALSLDLTIDLWAMDEVHFQQPRFALSDVGPARKPRTRCCVSTQPTRKSVGCYGAVTSARRPLLLPAGDE